MEGLTVNNSTNVMFSAAFQVAFALNVRAALLDVTVVWVLFHSFLGEKKGVLLTDAFSPHWLCLCRDYSVLRKVEEGRNVRAQLQWLKQPEMF